MLKAACLLGLSQCPIETTTRTRERTRARALFARLFF